MIRLHLPPNLAAAVPRNAIPLRVEIDLSQSPPADLLPVLALLQRWCGTSTPPAFLQLDRAKLGELVQAAGMQPIFVENGRPTVWTHQRMLAEAEAATAGSQIPSAGPRGATAAEAKRMRGVGGQPPVSTATPHATVSSGPRVLNSKPRALPAGPTVDGSEHFLALTLPSREHPAYAEILDLLKTSGFVLEPSNRKWWLRDRHRVLNFLAAHGARFRGEFGAQFTANFERNTARIQFAEVACDASEAGDGYQVTLALRAGPGGEGAVRSALAANRGYVEADGAVFLVDPARLRQLEAAQHALAGSPGAGVSALGTHHVSRARVAEVQEVLETLSPDFQPPETWRERSAALRDLSALAPAPVPPGTETHLRPYQRLGVAWLWHLYRHQLGGILADEMGLGKTLQALALLGATCAARTAPASSEPTPRQRLESSPPAGRQLAGANSAANAPCPFSASSRARPAGPSLVVCPASLLENWRRESARFAPQLRVFVHHGAKRLGAAGEAADFDLIVTSYGTLSRDWELLSSIRYDSVIADEAQHIKNRRSQNAAALRSLQAQSRFLLTGTPLENSFDDLRSLFEFLLPGYLDRLPAGIRGDERAWYDERLRAKVAPYILRRTKQAVAPELPPRLEQTVWCELTPAQAQLYRETQERTERELFDLEAGGASEAKLRFAALTQLLRLRQICCDPRLIRHEGAPDREEPGPTPRAFADSAKLDAFRELLAEAVDDGHRLLVFSQFTSLLGLLRDELTLQETPHCYLDGSMSPRARQAEVDRFQASPDVPVFLISLKAGGTGLNLTGADTVVHFDPWWNPAAEAQATDRAHRIGQTRLVTSYKLIASGTVEEKVLALQDEKRALLAGVFEASDATAAKLSLADLKSLLT